MGKPSAGKLYLVLRTVGELLVTLGVIVLLFVVYTLYVTDIVAARKQRDANSELDRTWSAPEQSRELAGGRPFTRLYIPRFGSDYRFVVTEGVGPAELDIGPGHYPNSARPGEPGNFAVAGHRIGKGAPFNDLDELRSCDPIVVETRSDFLVYRVLPMADEVGGWEQRRAKDARCERVPSLRSIPDYRETVGRKIVLPSRGDAVAPVPYRAKSRLPVAEQKALLTLTTCNPEYGNSERLIVHAVLTDQVGKRGENGFGGYRTLLRQMGEL